MLNNVVFLDRDGTINQDSADYIKGWSEFVFLPRSIEALRDLTAAGFIIIVITNQSSIPRKFISLQELENIHLKMIAAVESQGGKISDIFFCPHLPDAGCDCRKPEPGLIFQAQIKHDIDLSTAVMIGDSATDVNTAKAAGIPVVAVSFGYSEHPAHTLGADAVIDDYAELMDLLPGLLQN